MAEHQHWVREQRRQACSDIMDAYGTFILTVNRIADMIMNHVQPSDSDIPAIRIDGWRLVLAVDRVRLWGPEELATSAQGIRSEARELIALGWQLRDAMASPDPDALEDWLDQCTTRADAAKQARDVFTVAAYQALGDRT
ncbi:hypothetical protein [Streptomyces spongiae]|uniref:Uncharacterized protein n=1 Tax=Streptomyces spongiae TaxID=565072 RepID=A0A5N8XTZ6_9ACTN|nr:hypothetical protein [Streptomyces spongiae]MPY62676.1 hypothetical protein [Streptomyces spongiae]